MDIPYYREYELAWANTEQERKFHRMLAIVLAVTLVLGAIWPYLPVPEIDRFKEVDVPPRIAKLALEQRPAPAPLPRPEPTEPEPQSVEPEPQPVAPESRPAAEAAAERVVEAEPAPVPEAAPGPMGGDRTQRARERARAALMPFTTGLASLADSEVVERVTDGRPLTASVQPGTGSVGRAEQNVRSMIVSKAGQASGGINTASLSRNTGGTGLGGRATTQVESPVAGIGGSGLGGSGVAVGGGGGGGGGKASRSREEIELVFDRNKGAIFALYNRALRQDPTLQGKLVLRLTIAPSGEVTACEVISSELNNPEMEQKLVQRVLLFRFEPKDVERITTTKPIDFFPA